MTKFEEAMVSEAVDRVCRIIQSESPIKPPMQQNPPMSQVASGIGMVLGILASKNRIDRADLGCFLVWIKDFDDPKELARAVWGEIQE